ncbi:MAG TPA: class I SAM-dependent methyltransferase [Pirellulales bacterium]|jgi:2-polyprenyl-6-hydroxyphenyl methylase/3-demethylubiquinone-9 3-methyltransferase|nr:class I SAM-dependent methyltransferase [Pirellulales bacterium]
MLPPASSLPPPASFTDEVRRGERFAFGENWRAFLATVDERRIAQAERSLVTMLELSTLEGKTFVDAGCGSGLFSLAARRLGARVHSLDYDPSSVECAMELRRRFSPDETAWTIERGSVLDEACLRRLGEFDVVYSWGVVQHTGDMHTAMKRIAMLVKPGGKLFIAVYNDQGRRSRIWRRVKQAYCRLPRLLKPLVTIPAGVWLWAPSLMLDCLKLQPLRSWHDYSSERGMNPWRDLIDWVGGLPFEVAKPEEVFDLYRSLGFSLCKLITVGGRLGNNQFVFERRSWDPIANDVGEG